MPKKVYLLIYCFINTKCKKFEYFALFERPKKYMERHVTFLIFKNFATRHEVFFSSVDDFQISKSTPAQKREPYRYNINTVFQDLRGKSFFLEKVKSSHDLVFLVYLTFLSLLNFLLKKKK